VTLDKQEFGIVRFAGAEDWSAIGNSVLGSFGRGDELSSWFFGDDINSSTLGLVSEQE